MTAPAHKVIAKEHPPMPSERFMDVRESLGWMLVPDRVATLPVMAHEARLFLDALARRGLCVAPLALISPPEPDPHAHKQAGLPL